jgi:hypothetical protein
MAGVSDSIVGSSFSSANAHYPGIKYGNCSNAMPVNRINDRPLQSAPLYSRTGELHWSFAHS